MLNRKILQALIFTVSGAGLLLHIGARAEDREVTTVAGINVSQIESGAREMSRKLEEIDTLKTGTGSFRTVRRSPFASVLGTVPGTAIRDTVEYTHETLRPSLNFRVSGVLLGREKSYAIIDNRVLQEGEYIDGYEVFKISDENVYFKFMDDIVTFNLLPLTKEMIIEGE